MELVERHVRDQVFRSIASGRNYLFGVMDCSGRQIETGCIAGILMRSQMALGPGLGFAQLLVVVIASEDQ